MDGVLVVDKPAGPTSHDIVDRVRRALRTRRVGHTGTLDPFATGVLVLCVGRATRLARFLAAGEKAYRASVRLGFATTTDDRTGDPLGAERPVELDDARLRDALAGLVGTFDQVPPAFSARQVGGRRLYELARRGEAVARAATPVTIHAIELVVARRPNARAGRALLARHVRSGARARPGGAPRDRRSPRRPAPHALGCVRPVAGRVGRRPRRRPASVSSRSRQLLPELPAVRVGEEGRRLLGHGRELGLEHVLSELPPAGVERVRLVDERGRASGARASLPVSGRAQSPSASASRPAPGPRADRLTAAKGPRFPVFTRAAGADMLK